MKVACVGAGYVGGPTMAVIAARSPDVLVTVVDISQKQIDGTGVYAHHDKPVPRL